jgi:hypothetical protein
MIRRGLAVPAHDARVDAEPNENGSAPYPEIKN